MREEELLMQIWIKINPKNMERVETQIILEFLKLIYDPYTSSINSYKQEKLVNEYLQAIKRMMNDDF